ncbi:MAG: hypothetical protein HS116_20240 [Planctomycetes bacterium]|nr:hypothetical protein [Planctomycetota bacterium]
MKVTKGHNYLIAGAVALFVALRLLAWWSQPLADAEPVNLEPDLSIAASRVYYRIGTEAHLRVALEPGEDAVKIVSILEWPRQVLPFAEANLVPYALEVQLLDAQQRLLWQGRTWLQTRKTRKLREGGQAPLEPAFYLSGPDTLLDPRLLTVPVGRVAPGARFLTVRLAEPAAGAAVARCFRPFQLAGVEPLNAWDRLPYEQREELTRANLFDPSLLSDEERAQLVRQRWRVAIPVGDEGKDFQPVSIYLNPRELLEEDERTEPEEVHADLQPGHERVYNVEGPALVRLLARGPGGQAASVRVRLECEWREPNAPPRTELHPAALSSDQPSEIARWDLKAGPATLILRSLEGAGRVSLQANLPAPTGEAWRTLPIEDRAGYWYLCGTHDALQKWGMATQVPASPEEAAFDFELPETLHPEHGLYRLRVRPLRPPGGDTAAPTAVRAEFLDEFGARVATRDLAPPSAPDPLSWLTDRAVTCTVGQASAYYLAVPKYAHSLRISAETPCLVHLASRTASIPFDTYVPEDYSEGSDTRLRTGQEDAVQTWFSVRPRQHLAAFSRGRIVALHTALPWLAPREVFDDPEGERFGVAAIAHAGETQILWPAPKLEALREPVDWNTGSYVRLDPNEKRTFRLPQGFRVDADEPYLLRLLGRNPAAWPQLFQEPGRRPLEILRTVRGPDAASLGLFGTEARIVAEGDHAVFINALPEAVQPEQIWRLRTGYRASPTQPALFLLEKPGPGPVSVSLTLCATGHDGTDEAESAAPDSETPAAVVTLDDSAVAASDAPRFRMEVEVKALGTDAQSARAPIAESFTFQRRRFFIRSAWLGTGEALLGGARAQRLTETSRVFMPLKEDLPAGRYLIRVKPLGEYDLWLRMTARAEHKMLLPPGHQTVWHLRGPEVVRLRWRSHDPAKRREIAPLEVVAVTPEGAQPLKGVLEPTTGEGTEIAKQYLLPEGLMSFFVSHPARGEGKPEDAVEVELARRQGSAPAVRSVRIATPEGAPAWEPLDDELFTFTRWRLAAHDPPLQFEVPPEANGAAPALLHFEFRSLVSGTPPDWPAARSMVTATWYDSAGKELGASQHAVAFEQDSLSWVEGSSSHVSGAVGLDLELPAAARRVELRAAGNANAPLLAWAARRWREVPPIHLLHPSALRQAPVVVRTPLRFFDEYEALLPLPESGAKTLAPERYVAIRSSHAVLSVVESGDWTRLASSEGVLLPCSAEGGAMAFVEPSYMKVGAPLPWSPATFAHIQEGLTHAVAVSGGEGAPENIGVDLLVRYRLNEKFDPTKPIRVWLNQREAATLLPRTPAGVLRIPDVRPGKHLLRVVTGQPDAELFVNALPTENLGDLRYRAREAWIVPNDGRLEVRIDRPRQEAQTVHVALYVGDEQSAAWAEQKRFVVEAELLDRPEALPVGMLRGGTTRSARRFVIPVRDAGAPSFTVGGSARYRNAGLLFFPLEDDLPPGAYRLRIRFPSGLKVLARPFERVEKGTVERASYRLGYEPLQEER